MNTIAIYLRLSSEDGDLDTTNKEISNSIGNQRKLITDYIHSNPELALFSIEEYIDDGYSGTNFNRPAFQKLMKDAKEGSIDAIITKDFSRLGRDYLEVGNYLEYIFPILGIRYISVNDAFDSHKSKGMTGGMSVALKNIINSMYSEDLSKKVCAAQKVKAKNGEVVQALVHYGYMKDPNDIHKIIIDPEAAQVVRKIFAYAEETTNSAEIARRLNAEKIPSITQYFLNKGIKKNFSVNLDKPHFWTGSSIRMILRNESYKGTYTWGKTDQRLRTKRAMNKRGVDKDESEWIVIENHHEAIISPETFDRIQERLNSKRKGTAGNSIKSVKRLNLFRCPYCKHKIVTKNKTVYCGMKAVSLNKQCGMVSANKEQLEDVVVTTINQIAAYVMDCTENLMKKNESYDIIKSDVSVLQKEINKIPTLKMQKYDLYKQGKISQEQYQACIEEIYLNKIEQEGKLKQLLEELDKVETAFKAAENVQMIASNMILRNGYDVDVISKFVQYIDVYSETEIEIAFNVDDVFFKKILDELE